MTALVVGHGHMGRFHAKALRDLGYEVRTVDPYAPADYKTIEDAYGELAVKVACVATPVDDLVVSALKLAGTRRLMVEKPFASTAESAWALGEFLDAAGGRVCVGFVERFNPVVCVLKAHLDSEFAPEPVKARFTRWSDRPCPDLDLDLRLHDVDLAYWLGLEGCEVDYDTRTEVEKRRRIEIEYAHGGTSEVDLMAHDQSPLHALWHAFLSGGEYPKPVDAIRALQKLKAMVAA